MNQRCTHTAVEWQVAEAIAAEREHSRRSVALTLPVCTALALDFHYFGALGIEIGCEGMARASRRRRVRTASRNVWRTCLAGCLPPPRDAESRVRE
jgi:hypothetical protein